MRAAGSDGLRQVQSIKMVGDTADSDPFRALYLTGLYN